MEVGNTAQPAASAGDKAAIRQEVTDFLTELENRRKQQDQTKSAEDKAKGYEVGTDLNLQAKWVEGVGLVFASKNEDWKIHFGGRFQFEPVFFSQPQSLKGPGPAAGGLPNSAKNGGVDNLEDGAYFRRVRLRSDGVGYETIEYMMEVDFEQLNFTTFDHLWVGAKDLPFFDTVRIGQHKLPSGMENLGSDYHLTMLERSAGSDAFNILFAPGIWWSRNFADKNVAFQTMFSKTQQGGFYTSSFGDGNYASTTRLTWTPVYEDEGREIIHVGGSYQWRTANLGSQIQPGGTGSTFGDTQNAVRFRSRGDVRDAIGIGTGGNLGGNADRFVDTGFLSADGVHTVIPEFLAIWGPFSVQSEAYLVWVDNARSISQPGKPNTPAGTPFFWSSYVEASYFLTGERRGYDRRMGTYDRPVLDSNAFMVRGDDGIMHWNWGAWQAAYRFTYLDLNGNNINGGILGQHSVGMNWYVNNTTKVQFQYSIIQRDVVLPANSGTVHGYGVLAQWYF